MTVPILFANRARTTLAGAITSSATTANLAAGTGALFPSPVAPQYFLMTFQDAATGQLYEIVQVTARSNDQVTIVRAQEGSTAQAWQAGDVAANWWTAGSAAALVQIDAGFDVLTPGVTSVTNKGTVADVEMWGSGGGAGGASGAGSIPSAGGGGCYVRFVLSGLVVGASIGTTVPAGGAGGVPGGNGSAGAATVLNNYASAPGGGAGMGAGANSIAMTAGAGGGHATVVAGVTYDEWVGYGGGTGYNTGVALVGAAAGFGFGSAPYSFTSNSSTIQQGGASSYPGQGGAGSLNGGNGGNGGPGRILIRWRSQ